MAKRVRKTTPATPAASLKVPNPLLIPDEIVDAPEYHEYARAMGLLTWGTWDAEPRPWEERLKDFLQAYPADALARFLGPMLAKTDDGEYGPAPHDARFKRIGALDNSFGTLSEALARYGLKRHFAPPYVACETQVAPFREVARARNQRLRVLHGRVDIEAENMDEAKVAELERLERKQAAEQVRTARQEMQRQVHRDEGLGMADHPPR
jgi:hypothetical protein